MARLNKSLNRKLYSYFITTLNAQPYRNGWLKVPICPHCGKDGGKYGINVSKNMTNCFRCEERPSAIDLVIQLEKLSSYKEALNFLSNGDFRYFEYKDEDIELKESKPLYLPEGFNLIGSNPDTSIGKAAVKYIEKRGFNLQYVRRKGWGYCNTGPYMGYIILPFYQEGKLVYFNARRFIGGGPRYRNPDNTSAGTGKSFVLYNRDAIFMYKKVYLCEGIFNAETISSEKGIASSGKSLSRYQINDIIKSPVEQVVIILDPDAKIQAIDLALELVYHKKVKLVFLPEGKDINDIGRKEAMSIVRSSPYNNYSDLLKLKSKIRINEGTIHTY